MGCFDISDEYNTLLETISGVALNKMLQALTVEGTTWLKESGEGLLMCSRPALKPLAKVWYQAIRTHLLPTTHIETLNKERLILLYCILENRGVNIGKLIQRKISACAFKLKGGLFFPSLITELCLRLGLEISPADELLPNTGAINTAAIK